MKAVMYGGGNIGRGFLGVLFSQSGYDVTFIDVSQPTIDALNVRHSYPVRILDNDGSRDIVVKNVSAINGNDTEAAARCIAEADIMATAVGVNVLKFIIPNLVAGIRQQFARTDKPLNIIICENLNNANTILEDMLKEHLTPEECERFDRQIGLVEASIGRMVPVQTDEMRDGDPMRVCVEPYDFLPVDKDAFRGEIPEIRNMIPFAPFDFFIKRKLFIHNMGHACCAYLGGLFGHEYIWQAIADPDIYLIVQNAMESSALALSRKYGVELSILLLHIQDLLFRFTNRALQDTCDRVGRDPARKLSPDDRLIGAYRLCQETGVDSSFIAVGIAGALHRYLAESGQQQAVSHAVDALQALSGCSVPTAIRYYEGLLSGISLAAVRNSAETARHIELEKII